MEDRAEKVIIVEGKSDKRKIEPIIKENVQIVCTHGTMGVEKLDEWVERFYDQDLYIMVDADYSGDKLRRQFIQEFPFARHLYIDRVYKEVAAAPEQHLAMLLAAANIDIHPEFLIGTGSENK